jgi:hypothetical protein
VKWEGVGQEGQGGWIQDQKEGGNPLLQEEAQEPPFLLRRLI